MKNTIREMAEHYIGDDDVEYAESVRKDLHNEMCSNIFVTIIMGAVLIGIIGLIIAISILGGSERITVDDLRMAVCACALLIFGCVVGIVFVYANIIDVANRVIHDQKCFEKKLDDLGYGYNKDSGELYVTSDDDEDTEDDGSGTLGFIDNGGIKDGKDDVTCCTVSRRRV